MFDENNFNRHTKEGMELLEKSIRTVGVIEGVTVSSDGKVISGNARKEKIEQVTEGAEPIVIETDGTRPVVIKRTDIKSGTREFHEAALLANTVSVKNINLNEQLIKSVAVEMFDIDVTELGIDIINPGNDVSDDGYTPEEEAKIQTDIKVGDVFEIEHDGIIHRLSCGDSTSPEDIGRLLGGEKADMIFADPPYGTEGTTSILMSLAAKNDCNIFVMNSDKSLVLDAAKNLQYFRRFFHVDFKRANLVSNSSPMTRADLIAHFNKGKINFKNLHDGFSTLIECTKIHSDNVSGNFGHKQAKKPELSGAFIIHYTDVGDLIFDPFGGSGSTLIAAEQLKRRCYTQEFEPECCQIIIDRFLKSYPEAIIRKI
jgi:16S rRNA G966 N2-methylase RsmD